MAWHPSAKHPNPLAALRRVVSSNAEGLPIELTERRGDHVRVAPVEVATAGPVAVPEAGAVAGSEPVARGGAVAGGGPVAAESGAVPESGAVAAEPEAAEPEAGRGAVAGSESGAVLEAVAGSESGAVLEAVAGSESGAVLEAVAEAGPVPGGEPAAPAVPATTSTATATAPKVAPPRSRRSPLPNRPARPPDRPPIGAITSTPDAAALPGRAIAPSATVGPAPGELAPLATEPGIPAGPWSTTADAPAATPTLLRLGIPRPAGWLGPGSSVDGLTASATGRSVTVEALPEVGSAYPAPRGRRAHTAWQVLVSMLVCLGLWGLVDAPTLYQHAQTSQIGTRRRVAMDILRPISRVSTFLSLDRIDHLADDITGRSDHSSAATALPPIGPAPVSAPGPTAASPPLATTPSATAAPLTPTTLPSLRVPTAAAPLRVLAIGDSIGLTFGQSVADKLDASGLAHTTVDAREGTGLARPDSFDWPQQVRADIVQFHPELVVAMFGGNDDQDLTVGGHDVPFGSAAWSADYAARVRELSLTVTGSGAHLVWAGLPVMRSSSRNARYAQVMAATQNGLAGIPGALFVDNTLTLAGPQGQYEDALTNPGGQEVIVREPDGIHVSPAGGDILAGRVIGALDTAWHAQL